MEAATEQVPSEQDVIGWFDSLSNWGRWGDDDRLGTLNLVTPEKSIAAARLVRHGVAVSCAWDVKAGQRIGEGQPPLRYMIETGLSGAAQLEPDHAGGDPRWRAAMEFLGMAYHGHAFTHVDSLAHFFWDGQMYGGKPAYLVTDKQGALVHDVLPLGRGISTRGVLLDVASALGVETVPADRPVFPGDLELAEERCGVRVEPGDILMMRMGEGLRRRRDGRAYDPTPPHSGYHAACLPWLRERGVSILASDTGQDVSPAGYAALPYPVHSVGIVAMGLWMLDNCQLEDLAAACTRLGQWEFQMTIGAIPFQGATGGPVNPIAVL